LGLNLLWRSAGHNLHCAVKIPHTYELFEQPIPNCCRKLTAFRVQGGGAVSRRRCWNSTQRRGTVHARRAPTRGRGPRAAARRARGGVACARPRNRRGGAHATAWPVAHAHRGGGTHAVARLARGGMTHTLVGGGGPLLDGEADHSPLGRDEGNYCSCRNIR
jgi:hypothetical protein